MKKKILLCAAICAMILAAAAGCSGQSDSQSSEGTSSAGVQSETDTQSADVPVSSEQAASDAASDANTETAVLYIGMNGQFREYPYTFTQQPTPDQLIQAIADTTGWNLSLADITTTGKGGVTVSFASDSALFTGPPEPQKEEFHVYDLEQLCRTILDSIQATLQNNIIDPTLGDPGNLHVYYCMEGDKPLEIANLNITIPMEQPYSTDMWNYLSRDPGQG